MDKNPSIAQFSSSVIDTGRRGNPRPGCDCVQCFGYCLVDRDEAERAAFNRSVIAGEREERI